MINLREIEKNAYVSYHQDGLIEIMVGIYILTTIGYYFLDMLWLSAVIIILLTPVYTMAKRKFTVPRIGYAKFGKHGKFRRYFILSIFMGLFLVGLILGILLSIDAIPGWVLIILENNISLLIGIVAAVLSLIMVINTGIKRFYLYSAFLLIVFIVGQVLKINFLILFISTGAFFTITGIVMLIHFVRKYPVAKEGA